MSAKGKAPFAVPGVGDLKKKARWLHLHVRAWLGKRLRRFYLRQLHRHYARCVHRPFDRQASAKLDAALFLLEAEASEGAEG
ncbi:hypothetical protein NNJEOMEG_00162 [Fundidesulfovibrio magnetotacticus]|uniref:Uncharacterized protein n=1 Tax=Fundidesulfovibrio magnetotacticus TaxID=2730080 RepID=A0A6V8LPR9_9BACT|nr:hypothetical protein [Fundidesulfovibrio magnetotacticus]GFK92338.1 hypothetical protein NNJEOMEG_00162 [Fundidesulfovibrio magnetotacticus]